MDIKETDEHIVLEGETSSGAKYEIGYPKDSGYTKENVGESIEKTEQGLTSSDGFEEINWQVGHAPSENYTSREAVAIGINSGSGQVQKDPSAVQYTYRCIFTNTKGWSFTFKDESGDTYWISTSRNGTHHFDYNSTKPNMVGVK